MNSYKKILNITGWLVFAIAAIVYLMSAERTGSLWDCGEFILGAHKLQVVHPPGAALFLLIGRMFTLMAEIFTDTEANPENIAFAVNILSSLCSAFAAMFICWVTMRLGHLTLQKENTATISENLTDGQHLALAGAGLTAGLATAFTTSVWFSAVEGEVYAMSTFFTCLTLWAVVKWYTLEDTRQNDRWIIFAIYAGGLSIGVHLLSLLTFPALALFYYFKRYKNHNFVGMMAATGLGIVGFVAIQKLIITGIPNLWRYMELFTVNGLGLPFHSGIIPTVLIIGAIFYFGLKYAHQTANHLLQIGLVSALLVVISFSTIGVVVIRANANTPINMNAPSDPMRLLPYLNREQYGERPLLYGPDYTASPVDNIIEERYGQVGDRYEIVDEKIAYKYDSRDKHLLPRMGDNTQNRPEKYQAWTNHKGSPSFADNIAYLFKYQIGWMYWRYFFWNFAGRQNGEQGYYKWDKSSGHWMTGIPFVDESHLEYNMDYEPDTMKNTASRNKYYMLPFIFGLLGLFFHATKRKNDFFALLTLFIITGIGIIIYSNQPPNEPRERDYVLVGSFFTFCIWIGMGALFLFETLREKAKLDGKVAAVIGSLIVLAAPILMGTQNFDDHSRAHHSGARDYASNFLESCEPNALIFTYGDNDTYPLWYAQEIEGIRTDVRVVNLSLIAVDWYIDQLRRKVNDSPPVKMTVPREAYRGKLRNTVLYYNPSDQDPPMEAKEFLKFIGEEHPLRGAGGREIETFMPTRNVYLDVDLNKMRQTGALTDADTVGVVNRIPIKLAGKNYLIKDELAILDVIVSNIEDRPVYFAVTCRPEKMFGLQDYMQLEGLSLRIIPVKSNSDQGLYVYGSGRVSTEHVYNNVMNKFLWGNFDKVDTHVDRSYGPSIQSHRVVMMRAAREMVKKGEKEKAVELLEKYFEAFPHMNFPYNYHTWQMIRVMLDADAYDKAKPHIETLAAETADFLEFYFSLSAHHLDPETGSFGQDFQLFMATKEQILRAVKEEGDEEYLKELEQLFEGYDITKIPG